MANNENKAPTMDNNENKAPKADERVELFVPRGYANDEPNLTISVNCVNYVLPKGKTSLVPAFVKAEYERSRRAAEKQSENIEKLALKESK